MKEQQIPGLSLAIIRNNQAVLARGYGYSNIEHKIPVKLETVFQSGSVGKQFTAMAILMLVEMESLELDVPLGTYLEDLPKSWKRMTVRHLLTHTAGLGDYSDDFNYREDITEDDMLELIKSTPLASQPGEVWAYSNLGYALLGILIHQLTDEYYGDFLQSHVFKPLGMTSARVISESDIIPNRASGYVCVDGEIKNQEWVAPTLNTFADGALYLSIQDMIAWTVGLNSNKLLKDRKSFESMWSPAKLNDGSNSAYGFGWSLTRTVSGMRVAKHGGLWQGFQSMIIRVLDARVTVVVLANLDTADIDNIAAHSLVMYDSQCALKSSDDEDE